MCTSFVFKGNDTIIGMNFDNHGMNYSLNTRNKNKFAVSIEHGGRCYESFGITSNGIFGGQLVVNPNGKANYKRASSKCTHTSKLIREMLSGKLSINDLEKELYIKEVVNVPDMSLHCLFADKEGNTVVIEPGRGNIIKKLKQKEFVVLSNCPVCGEDSFNGFGVERYESASKTLSNANLDFGVKDAIALLRSVSQTEGDWITEFSLIYSANENAVYYCYNNQFDKVKKYFFNPNEH